MKTYHRIQQWLNFLLEASAAENLENDPREGPGAGVDLILVFDLRAIVLL